MHKNHNIEPKRNTNSPSEKNVLKQDEAKKKKKKCLKSIFFLRLSIDEH